MAFPARPSHSLQRHGGQQLVRSRGRLYAGHHTLCKHFLRLILCDLAVDAVGLIQKGPSLRCLARLVPCIEWLSFGPVVL